MIRKILLSLIVLEVIAMSLSATEKQTRKAVEEKIELLGSSLSEEEYLELLTKYKEWEESVC